MTYKDKKMAVLDLLRLEKEAVSLKTLLQKLGEGFAERTVRRWLSELETDELVEKQGQKRGTKYKIRMQSNHSIEGFQEKNRKVIEQVQRPLYERMPVSYKDKWVQFYIPNKSYYIPKNFRLKLKKLGARKNQDAPAGTYAHQVFERLLIDLSYNSSRLEGNTYSLLETKKLLLEGKGVEGKLDEEKTMILNHKEAIRFLVDSAPRLEVTNQTICTVHYLLSDGLIETAYSGKIRDHGVRIGGSTYIPIENPKRLEFQLTQVTEKASLIEDPFEQSLFLLVHLSYLQAFTDVNKRAARLCANIPLIKNNLVPLSFNDVKTEDYTSAIIAIYEYQDTNPLLDLYQFSYQRACVMYDSTIEAISFDEVRVRYRQQRWELIREVITQKMAGKELQDYIKSYALKNIKDEDGEAFCEDALEDLEEMDQARIAGLGVTPQQLKAWMELQ
ncbi:MAG: Fic family protein [Chlamydiia bacterium]|nr:Fic family protein [Chlamydiia bacterium]